MSVNVNETPSPPNIWEGILQDFQTAQRLSSGDGFSGERWLDQNFEVARQALQLIQQRKPLPQRFVQRFHLLPIVASLLLSRSEKLKVIDVGGGFGISFLNLLETVPNAAEKIEYTVVELPKVCDAAQNFWNSTSIKINFASDLKMCTDADLIICCSSLQYIEDWQSFVRLLASNVKDSGHIFLGDVPCGNIKTFATLQNYYESKIPYWFFSEAEIISQFHECGFTLLSKIFSFDQRAGFANKMPMHNFPDDYIIPNPQHLLFSKLK